MNPSMPHHFANFSTYNSLATAAASQEPRTPAHNLVSSRIDAIYRSSATNASQEPRTPTHNLVSSAIDAIYRSSATNASQGNLESALSQSSSILSMPQQEERVESTSESKNNSFMETPKNKGTLANLEFHDEESFLKRIEEREASRPVDLFVKDATSRCLFGLPIQHNPQSNKENE